MHVLSDDHLRTFILYGVWNQHCLRNHLSRASWIPAVGENIIEKQGQTESAYQCGRRRSSAGISWLPKFLIRRSMSLLQCARGHVHANCSLRFSALEVVATNGCCSLLSRACLRLNWTQSSTRHGLSRGASADDKTMISNIVFFIFSIFFGHTFLPRRLCQEVETKSFERYRVHF